MSNKENDCVQKNVHLMQQFQEIVLKIVHVRKEAGFSQQFMADWLNVDRRKIIALESGKNFDLFFISNYAEKLGLDVNITFY